ncbi:MAG: isoprenylcysteine carboxylmethyltransferase family protein [Burkholderiaceae bacterium]|nr:isoprenylcysteine carboxylmethyltransferase family protein [Burkholderiaceae bacterium]
MRLDQLELRVPPLALTAAAAAAIGLLPAQNAPFIDTALAWGVGITAMVFGVGIALLGVAAFRRARTTVDPRHPERSCEIVQTGVYARTRNPMYVGFVAVLLGMAIGLQSLPGIALTALVAAYLHRFQILPEERWLRQRFADEFVAYCKRAARWL